MFRIYGDSTNRGTYQPRLHIINSNIFAFIPQLLNFSLWTSLTNQLSLGVSGIHSIQIYLNCLCLACNMMNKDFHRHTFVFMQEWLIPLRDYSQKDSYSTKFLSLSSYVPSFLLKFPFYDMQIHIWFHFSSSNLLSMYSSSIMINVLCIDNFRKNLPRPLHINTLFPFITFLFSKRTYLSLKHNEMTHKHQECSLFLSTYESCILLL